MEENIETIISNLDKVPDNFWGTRQSYYGKEIKREVIWLIDRDRPSAGEQSYSFDMERFGITGDGKLIWGFDSGCSCPSPFEDGNYEDVPTYKEFILKEVPLDPDWKEEAQIVIDQILACIK